MCLQDTAATMIASELITWFAKVFQVSGIKSSVSFIKDNLMASKLDINEQNVNGTYTAIQFRVSEI